MKPDFLVTAAAAAGILACVGDIVIPTVLGRFFPGYDATREVLSRLGCADSPVRLWINGWWCLFGAFVVLFAFGFLREFGTVSVVSAATVGTVLLVIFGLGSGPGAGLFPMDVPGTAATRSGWLHSTLSGAGFFALVLFPAVCLAIFGSGINPTLFWISAGCFTAGLAGAALIALSSRTGATGLLALGGLWQRAFLVPFYIHITALAVVMLRSNVRG